MEMERVNGKWIARKSIAKDLSSLHFIEVANGLYTIGKDRYDKLGKRKFVNVDVVISWLNDDGVSVLVEALGGKLIESQKLRKTVDATLWS